MLGRVSSKTKPVKSKIVLIKSGELCWMLEQTVKFDLKTKCYNEMNLEYSHIIFNANYM